MRKQDFQKELSAYVGITSLLKDLSSQIHPRLGHLKLLVIFEEWRWGGGRRTNKEKQVSLSLLVFLIL